METREIHITQDDGSIWAVPVKIVARNRAAYYAHEFGGNYLHSLNEDTLPVFECDYEIIDWARFNMNWSDVKDQARLVDPTPDIGPDDFQEAWRNGKKVIVVAAS